MKHPLLSRTSLKYYASEILASLFALVGSAGSAYLLDKVTRSDILISAVSAVSGTAGFVVGLGLIYAILHIRHYRDGRRSFAADMKAIFKSNLHGVAAMYAVRIPFQFVLQRYWLSPPVAATIAQAFSGVVATAVRAYHNYKADIFAESTT
ncbi:MAG: hypothetical protein JXM79_12410 [Sedimentisphaerales bacterium]|nr:hypothetical protein [Sedimentisphaerales bacterium]